MNISIKSIIKDSSKFSGISNLRKLIQFPVTIVIASVLGPKDFGILAYAAIIIVYADCMKFAAMSTAYREMPALIKSGNIPRANEIKNLAFTIDFVTSIIVFLGLLIIALFHHNIIIRNIIILCSIGFLLLNFKKFIDVINFSYLNYSLIAKGELILAVFEPILSLILIFLLRIYTQPIVSIIGCILIIIYFLKKKSYGFKFVFNKLESFRLAKIGLSLNVATIISQLFFHTADRTIIALYFSKEMLGFYVFAFSIYLYISSLFDDYLRVLQPSIWSISENAPSSQEGFYPLRKMAVYFSIFTSAIIGLAQLAFILLVNYVIIKFNQSAWVFLILILYLFWGTQQGFSYFVLASSRINKQNIMNLFWAGALLLNILLDLAAVKLGYGVVGIAYATTISQAIFTLSLYFISSGYLFYKIKDFLEFLKIIILPFFIPVVLTIFHWIGLKNLNPLVLTFFSLILQGLLWFIIIRLFYKDYINKKVIFATAREVKNYLYNLIRRKLFKII